LAGIKVLLNGTPAPLLYASETMITYQCPAQSDIDSLSVVVRAENGETTAALQLRFEAVTPGVYSLDSSGRGQGAVLISESHQLAMLPTEGVPSRAVHEGEHLTVYANGLGEASEKLPAGSPAPMDRPVSLKNRIQIILGGEKLEPSFAGLAPGAAGLYQVNFQVPPGIQVGPAVPLVLEVINPDGSVTRSNEVTVAISIPVAPQSVARDAP
jgi:uncharacterized protein (TIGR03437 family)